MSTSLSTYMASVELEGARFASAAAAGPLDTPISACPGWDMRDLARHLGEIDLWAAANVADPKPKWLHVGELADLARHWPDLVVEVLGDADPFLRPIGGSASTRATE